MKDLVEQVRRIMRLSEETAAILDRLEWRMIQTRDTIFTQGRRWL
jgi:hypothetical protein